MPYAIAARFAYPGRPVIAFTGDGAFQMNGTNEMITFTRCGDRLAGGRRSSSASSTTRT